jgi:hypothetical protein
VPGDAGVVRRVLGVAVAEVVPHRPQISAFNGEVAAAGVPEHMGPDAPELCGVASDPHDIVDRLAGELRLPLGNEQPSQVVHTGGEAAL